jgi:archaellum biogenesis ATPase FlaH
LIYNNQNLIDIKKVPIFFIGNKLNKKKERVISEIDILNNIQRFNCSFLEISSLNIKHVKGAIDLMIRNILNKIKKIKIKGNIIFLNKNENNYDEDIIYNKTYILDDGKISIERNIDTLIPIIHKTKNESKNFC